LHTDSKRPYHRSQPIAGPHENTTPPNLWIPHRGRGGPRKTGARLELARALTDLGVHLRRAGSRAAARDPLTSALDLAHRGGATALAKRAREELLAAGARPRRPARLGTESLTPTERRVAELAASGHDNRSIAELTFVSRNTVAWHLRNVFRKLAVDSREALTEALAD
jgi:DNA-binding CsgD family transcriptional regulator